jgi:hypothetical protein
MEVSKSIGDNGQLYEMPLLISLGSVTPLRVTTLTLALNKNQGLLLEAKDEDQVEYDYFIIEGEKQIPKHHVCSGLA